MTVSDKYLRRIRSFVTRGGRTSKSQQAAIDKLWSVYGIDDSTELLDFDVLFNRSAPTVLEIGYGMGGSLAEMARAEPDKNFIGIEVHPPGTGNLLKLIDEYGMTNLRLYNDDAIPFIENNIAENSLHRVQLYFPDPWHKKKHNKRRIVQADFVQKIRQRLKLDGLFHLATDWEEYAEHMLDVMENAEGLKNINDTPFIQRPDFRPITKFEKRGLRLGHGIWDLIYQRVA